MKNINFLVVPSFQYHGLKAIQLSKISKRYILDIPLVS